MDSLWTKTAERREFPKLEGDHKTDVLIIGGGITGILCAYKLKEAGVDYTLVEADRILGGVSKNTTAKITLQHGLIYDKLIKKFGKEVARGYINANQAALDEYKLLCQGIECDYSEKDAFVYSLNSREKIEREVRAYEELGFSAEFYESVPLPFSISGAVGIKNQAEFHPLKFAFALADDLNIYEKTKVVELGVGQARTNSGKISAQKIIVATHFPILNKHGSYFLKLYQHRSYVIALKGADCVQGLYVDESDTGMSFRNAGELLLIGGGDHRTGKSGGGWSELENFAQKHYTGAEIEAKWATQDCISLDGVPYIGRYSKRTDGLYVATGFNKWGMSSAMVAATVLTAQITGEKNAYAHIFSPSRSILHPQLALNAVETLVNILTPTAPRCPHLGCALKYNKEEHSWDCPCHGSRFDETGRLIDNPATDDAKIGN